MINTKRKITVKEKFESTLLQLRSNLKSDSVTNALSTDKDKKLHEKLIDIVDKYYENIDLFDKQKETLQKLLLDNASYLLEKTNSTSFNIYLPNYRNYANFLVDNYYKNENNTTINNKENKHINEIKTTLSNDNILINLEKLKNIDLANYDLATLNRT